MASGWLEPTTMPYRSANSGFSRYLLKKSEYGCMAGHR
jgi:hypothetical protein